MKNLFLIVIVTILLSFPALLFSQELNFALESGLGTYQMSDLREFNNINLRSLIFEAKQTDDFPAYWRNKASLLFSFRQLLSVGVKLSQESTGSRISREDYSGEYLFDAGIRAYSPGAIIEVYKEMNKFRISLSNEAGIEYSKLRFNEYIRVKSESARTLYIFTSKNIYYEPSVRLSYPIMFFRAGITAGYLFDLKKEAFLSTDFSKTNINLPNGELARADWSGARIGLNLSFDILQIFRSTEKTKEPGRLPAS